jgi:hypothetical protein
MSIRNFSFGFTELSVDRERISSLMGYTADSLPDPFRDYLEDAFYEARMADDIKACYKIFKKIDIDKESHILKVEGYEFLTGRTVYSELNGSDEVAVFVCTAGKKLSDRSKNLIQGPEPVKGYIFDLLGNEIAESVCEKIQQNIDHYANETGRKITNRYSPGYCNWDVADQQKLFKLMGGNPCAVRLSDSLVMSPLKSVSGVIGIGRNVTYRDYPCELCSINECIYRSTG